MKRIAYHRLAAAKLIKSARFYDRRRPKLGDQCRGGRTRKDMSANSCLERPPSLEYEILMTLKAIVHKAEEGGYWAEVPSLPGCVTQAETRDELQANLREAIELWLSVGDETTKSNPSDEFLELTV